MGCLSTFASCAFAALLPREPEAVSLSNHRIARDTPAKLFRNHAGGLSRQPKAGQQLCSCLVPLHRHTGSRSCLPLAMVRRVLAGRLGLSFRPEPTLELGKERRARDRRGVGRSGLNGFHSGFHLVWCKQIRLSPNR